MIRLIVSFGIFEMPLVSVVTTVFNAGKYLPDTLRSILDQSFPDFEFLIVDDGSTDGSVETVRKFAALDPRIRPFQSSHRGGVAAANFGIAHATGKYLARIDHDDIALPDRFQKQVWFLEMHPDYVVTGMAYDVIGPDGSLLPNRRPFYTDDNRLRELLPRECPFCHSSVMMRLEAVRACGGYREAFATADDYDLWVRLSCLGRLANLPETGVQWRRHGTQSSVRNLEQMALADIGVKLLATRLAAGQPDPFLSLTGLITRSDLGRAGVTDAEIHRHILDMYELTAQEFENGENPAASAVTLKRAIDFARSAPGVTADEAARYGSLLALCYAGQKRFLRSMRALVSALFLSPGYPGRWIRRHYLS